jgi:hypothetical protein
LLKKHTLTENEINLGKLGAVPSAGFAKGASHASTADSAARASTADSAAHASTADSATSFGGLTPSQYLHANTFSGFQSTATFNGTLTLATLSTPTIAPGAYLLIARVEPDQTGVSPSLAMNCNLTGPSGAPSTAPARASSRMRGRAPVGGDRHLDHRGRGRGELQHVWKPPVFAVRAALDRPPRLRDSHRHAELAQRGPEPVAPTAVTVIGDVHGARLERVDYDITASPGVAQELAAIVRDDGPDDQQVSVAAGAAPLRTRLKP